MIKSSGIQITNQCNAGCIGCDGKMCSRPRRDMKPEELDKIVSDIQRLGIGGRHAPTGICGIAEGLLHPAFSEMASIMSRIPWCFSTNGIAFNEKRRTAVLDNKPVVAAVTMNFVSDKVAKLMGMGSSNNASKSIENTCAFIEETRARKEVWDREFYIVMVVSKHNLPELQEWIDFWLPKIEGIPGFKLMAKPMISWPRLRSVVDPVMIDAFPPMEPHPLVVLTTAPPPVIRPTCQLLKSFAWVMSDGSYIPCCMCSDDLWHVGNVLEIGFEGCYNSDAMNKYRALHDQKRYSELPLCGTCR